MNTPYVEGFIARAQQHGFSAKQSDEMLKSAGIADTLRRILARIGSPVSRGLGAVGKAVGLGGNEMVQQFQHAPKINSIMSNPRLAEAAKRFPNAAARGDNARKLLERTGAGTLATAGGLGLGGLALANREEPEPTIMSRLRGMTMTE